MYSYLELLLNLGKNCILFVIIGPEETEISLYLYRGKFLVLLVLAYLDVSHFLSSN